MPYHQQRKLHVSHRKRPPDGNPGGLEILRLSMDLPMVIEIVDTEEEVNRPLPILDEIMSGRFVTLEKIKIIHYRHSTAPDL